LRYAPGGKPALAGDVTAERGDCRLIDATRKSIHSTSECNAQVWTQQAIVDGLRHFALNAGARPINDGAIGKPSLEGEER
jgi:hypothetical protein